MKLVMVALMMTAGAATADAAAAAKAAEPADPYLWLEAVDSPQALDWVKARDAETMASLGASPRFATLKAEALAVLTAQDRIPNPTLRGGFIYNFWQDETHVKGLWRRATPASYKTDTPQWDVLLDLDALGKAEHVSWVFKGADCLSPDYTRCMISLSDGGQDAVVMREFDVSKRAFVEGGFRLDQAKQETSWLDKDTLLLARAGAGDEETTSGYARKVRLWHRGTAPADAKVVFEAEKAHVAAGAGILEHGRDRVVLLVRAVSFFENEYAILDKPGAVHALAVPKDCDVAGFYDGQVILSLRSDWPSGGVVFPAGAYVSFPLEPVVAGALPSVALLFAPSETQAINGLSVAADAVYVNYLDNVAGRIAAYRLVKGEWRGAPVELGDKGAVDLAASSPFDTRVFVTYKDFLQPDSLLTWAKTGAKPETWKTLPARFKPDGLIVTQASATSKDGTRIPYFLVSLTGAKGAQPTLLYAYGGFEVSETPFYSPTLGKLWLEKGGQYALANIRGGGEFGPRWHKAALKENRQKAFDDFAAVAEDLIAQGATSAAKLGIMGGSNGGLLMGAEFTQHPELCKAVVIQVPLLDMLRYTHLGAGSSWIGEYGDPDVAAERAYIAAYSPYQALKKGTKYPVPLIYTSTRDDRVHPGHARKFAARLLEQGHKFYYFERIEGGHAAGADLVQTAEEKALEYTYLAHMLMDEGK
jgi:prolyl oligopeptidase